MSILERFALQHTALSGHKAEFNSLTGAQLIINIQETHEGTLII